VAVIACVAMTAACATTPPTPPTMARSTPARPTAISGVVFGADGKPLEGARVILQRLGAAAPILSAADPMVRTSAEGRFAFDEPAAGRYQLLLLHPTLGWLMAQGVSPGRTVRLVFDGKVRVVDIGR